MRTILLLSSFLSFLFSFPELFHYNIKNFDVIQTPKHYKLILKDQQFFKYSLEGFKFFIPKFTKELNLKILRFNSTGIISGYLSMDKTFSKPLNISPSDLQYYITDYKSNGRQLDYLLQGYTIPYEKVTSISIEAYNIPPKIYNKLNKFVYFKIKHSPSNNLKYLVYSFYIILDKQKVDAILHKNKISFKEYLNNIYSIDTNSKPPTKKRKKEKKKKALPYALKLKLFLYMKEYGFIPQEKKYEIESNIDNNKLIDIYSQLNGLTYKLKSKFDKSVMLNPKEKIQPFIEEINNLADKIYNLNFYAKLKKPDCIDYTSNNSKCFKDPIYFHNFVYFKLKQNSPVDIDTLIKYGDYKTFNDIAKYYFEIGAFKKAEILLQKAYALKKDPIIVHNLAVLYMTYSPLFDTRKGIQYLKESTLQIDYYNLGVLYYIGKGVKESDKIARKYFEKAPDIPYAKENIKIMNKYKIGF